MLWWVVLTGSADAVVFEYKTGAQAPTAPNQLVCVLVLRPHSIFQYICPLFFSFCTLIFAPFFFEFFLPCLLEEVGRV